MLLLSLTLATGWMVTAAYFGTKLGKAIRLAEEREHVMRADVDWLLATIDYAEADAAVPYDEDDVATREIPKIAAVTPLRPYYT